MAACSGGAHIFGVLRHENNLTSVIDIFLRAQCFKLTPDKVTLIAIVNKASQRNQENVKMISIRQLKETVSSLMVIVEMNCDECSSLIT